MIGHLVEQLSGWLATHPHLAGLVVGLIACAESLAIIGALVPGTVLIFGAGALIATGALGFWSTLAWAVAGAVAGDGVSYWLGHHYRERIPQMWPLRTHPELLARGRTYFEAHGGKSIVLGRFVGPVRAVVPVIAGMLGMSPARFTAMNVFSAVVWAPAHLLPGMAFGASLALAGAVAGRLAVLLGAVVAAMWLIVWVTRHVYVGLFRHAQQSLSLATGWARRHPHLSWLVTDLVEPERPARRALGVWFALLAVATWLFTKVLRGVVTGASFARADEAVFQFLHGLRSAPADAAMVVVGELGHPIVLAAVTAAVAAVLLVRRSWREAGYWLGAIVVAAIAVLVMRVFIDAPPPGVPGGQWHGFPSARVTLSTVTYGALASLSARELSPGWRPVPYAAAAVLVGAITFAGLYLGADGISAALGGIALGVLWGSLVSIAEHRHVRTAESVRGVGLAGLAALAAASFVVLPARYGSELARHEPVAAVRTVGESAWWSGGGRALPGFRTDLSGREEEPLNVQWAAPPDEVRRALTDAGWTEPAPLGFATALRWLSPAPSLDVLPVLPKMHDGAREVLVLVHDEPGAPAGERLVLRLWRAHVKLAPGGEPVLVGTVTRQKLEKLPLVRFPHETGAFAAGVAGLAGTLAGWEEKLVPAKEGGPTLLLREARERQPAGRRP